MTLCSYVLLNEVLDDLEVVRERVIAHIEQIHALKEDVMADPEQFVRWLREGVRQQATEAQRAILVARRVRAD